MKRVLKWVAVAGLLVAMVLAVGGGIGWSKGVAKATRQWNVQPAPVAIPTDAASLAEGARLFAARGCKKCHGDDGGGVLVLELPGMGTAWGANLTQGQGSAVRAYSVVDWVRTIRHGVKPSGLPLQVMDSKEYQYLSDRDLGLILAAIRALPPVDRTIPPVDIKPLAYIWHGLGWLDVTTADQVDHARVHCEEPVPSAQPEFGRYVLRLQCQGCHGDTLSGGKLSGAPGLPIPPNLTPDDATGLGRWTFEQFATVMRTGQRPDGGVLDKFMPWDTYASMSDDELTAIWGYLRSQPARPFGGR